MVFVNLHPRDLEHPGLLDAATPLASIANRVVLEVAERASLDGFEGLHERVAELGSRTP